MIIKQCKTRYINLDKALLFLRNHFFCLKNQKLLRAATTLEFNIFFLKFRTRFLLTNVYINLFGIVLFCLDLELFGKIRKGLVSINPSTLQQTLVSRKRVQNFSKKYYTLLQLKLTESINFPDKQLGFLEIIELCLSLGIEFGTT